MFLCATCMVAQRPNWTVDENNFEFSTTRVAFLNVDGQELSSSNDMVAAFVNNETRGVASLVSVSGSSRKYAYLTVFSNSDGETIQYKVYNSTTDAVSDVPNTDLFNINQHRGNLYQAFSVASPALNNAVQLINVDFDNIEELDVIVNDSQVIVQVDDAVDITSLNLFFTTSDGAQLLRSGEKIESGTNAFNFTTDQNFVIRSEDESVVKDWTITVQKVVNQINVATATFFKKDAVCHTNGVIKVSFPINGAPSTLRRDGALFANTTVQDNTILYSDLPAGTYTVEIGSYNKSIVINLNQ